MSTYRTESGHDADGIEDGWAVIRTMDEDDVDEDEVGEESVVAVVSTETVAELLMEALERGVTFMLRQVTEHGDDPETPKPGLAVKAIQGRGHLTLDIDGCGLNTMENDGQVLYLENQNGVPVLYVWGDVNSDDPTHKISLAGALETARTPEFPEWGVLSDAKLALAVSKAKQTARRSATEQMGFVQARGVHLCTGHDTEGQVPPNVEAECPEWHNTSAEIRSLAVEVMAKWPGVDSIYISGGYDWAESRAEMELGDYQPWASEWSVTVWTREKGYPEELRG